MEEIAEAIMAVVVTVLVIIVLATVVSIAISLIKVWIYMPPMQPENPPSTNSEVYFQEAINGNTTIAGNIAPTYGPFYTNYVGPDISSPSPDGFTIQYGVDANTNPWITVAGENIPQNEIGYVSEDANSFGTLSTNVENVSTNYEFSLTLNGIGTLNYESQNTNGENIETYLSNSNIDETETNGEGDVMTYTPTPYPQSTNCVIILRSTNLLAWQSIYTNYVSPGGISYYTDTNIFWPTEVTYYNTNTGGSGGGLTPPGDTNDMGTNGVYYIQAGAYYRLAYPSNQADYFSP